jgi:hypothetical protein
LSKIPTSILKTPVPIIAVILLLPILCISPLAYCRRLTPHAHREAAYKIKSKTGVCTMYTLCTLNGKELDTGHNSSPNSKCRIEKNWNGYRFANFLLK